ncbi:MAG: hypothetical protein KBE65_11305 [Phycisphaerae bacterium]|nr:hypothetical protein [Phycisphaerae bacterium]
MRDVSFDKKRAEELLEALRNHEPIALEPGDYLLLPALCLAVQHSGEVKALAEDREKHREHVELEAIQSRNDLLATLLFLKTLVTYVMVGEYDKYCAEKVWAVVELTQEPRYEAKALRGIRPGCPCCPQPWA